MTFSFDNFEEVCSSYGDREEWLAARRSGISSSDASALMGRGFNGRGPAEVWASKVNIPGELEPPEEWALWGHALEEVIVEQYSTPRYAGRRAELDGVLLRSKRWPFLLCTMDARTWIDVGPSELLKPEAECIPLEVKNVSSFAAEMWINGVPERYVDQVHVQMLVTGARTASVACLIGGNQLAWADVDFDEALGARILARAKKLWDAVLLREMPMDHSVSGRRVITRMHPRHEPDSVVALPAELMEADDDYLDAHEAINEAKRQKEEAQTKIARAIGKHELGVLPNGVEWTFKTNKKGSRVLRRKEPRA